MARCTHLVQLVLLFILQGAWLCGVRGIRLTAVHIPGHVARGVSARLECHFDLEGEVLYAVKWYKDGKEFYQYVPAHDPPEQSFPLPGVIVDVARSSRSAVTLESVGAAAGGVYRCEVSGEAPNFNTVSDGRAMEVVLLPKEGPAIAGGSSQYTIGDVADLNCTSAASRPKAQLSWLINERPAPAHLTTESWSTQMPNGTLVVTSHLRFKVTAHHFDLGYLKIKCVATIASVYEQSDAHSAGGADVTRPLPEPVLHQAATDAAAHRPAPDADLHGDIANSGAEWSRGILEYRGVVILIWTVVHLNHKKGFIVLM